MKLQPDEIEVLVEWYADRLKSLCGGVPGSQDRRDYAKERLARLAELLELYSELEDEPG